MKKLISMRDFVLNVPVKGMEVQSLGIQGNNRYQLCIRYANFLSQPLTLGMFVPTDFEGNVLEEPNEIGGIVQYPEEMKEYQKAKEACLFEGVNEIQANIIMPYGIIENIISFDLTLTPTALKTLGL